MRIRACAMLMSVVAAVATAAEIAIVDVADEWTQIAAVAPSLDEMDMAYDDLTGDVEGGTLNLSGNVLLIISSMATNNASVHQGLDDNAQVIQDFVSSGGVVIETTQADQNEANVDWLPSGLTAVRSDPDQAEFTIEDADHPLFNTPHKMIDDDFVGWGHQGWPTVWEVFATLEGFDVLATSAGKNVIGEADHGNGKFVMMCIAPDKYSQVGNDANTLDMATLFFQNMVTTYLPQAVSPEGLATTTWAELRSQ
jgi:hypothetical protein